MRSRTDPPSASHALALAQAAAQRGDRHLAHAICVQLVAENPTNEQAWLMRADMAETPEEKSAALSQALTLNPADRAARRQLYETMQQLLRRDAFLAYLAETIVPTLTPRLPTQAPTSPLPSQVPTLPLPAQVSTRPSPTPAATAAPTLPTYAPTPLPHPT